MSEPAPIEWRPEWAKHVVGRWHERVVDPETGQPEPQKVVVVCEHEGCGGKWQTTCSTGSVRTHVARYAHQHLHRDALAEPYRRPE